MRFEHSHLLWLLLVLPPALVLFFWWAWRQRQKILTQFISARLLPALTVGISPVRQRIRAACLISAVALLIVTLARPQWGYTLEEVKQRGLDIVMAIDTSKSMLATDIAPNRLARAKLAALDLMQQAKSDRLGLVAFAGSAFLQCPLTSDDTAFRESVDALDVNIIPQGGTAIAGAIRTALTAFKESDNFKVLVLFTDGEDNDNKEAALEAAQAAANEGMKIFTIGIGSKDGEILRVTDGNGNSDYIRDEQGNVVKSHLNENLLQQIAGATEGGFYLPLSGAKTMDTLYERGLAPLPKSDRGEKTLKRYREQYFWPLAAAIVLLLVETLLPERKRERAAGKKTVETVSAALPPNTGLKPGANESRTTAATVALILFLLLPALAFAFPDSALKDYNAKKFAAAQKEYERLAAQDKTGDARLVFNAGAAAYRATNYDAAIKLFTTAQTARDLKLQQAAYFNLGNTQYRVGTLATNLDDMQETWETAIKSYQHALALNTNDVDAKFNLTFVQNNVEMIVQLREAALKAKQAADEATRRRNYHRALEIMENLIQNNPTAKQFEDYAKKLKDIDEIATPNQP